MFNPKFEELKATGNLPTPSGVALEILKLTRSDNVSIEQLLKPVKSDPVLAGRVLKLVNSASYGPTQPIVSLKEAIIRLGINVLSGLALSLSIFDASREGNCPAFDYDQFWSTSLLRGLAMQGIAELTAETQPEEAFTIGLIADIGKLVLAQIYPAEYSDCLMQFQQSIQTASRCKQCFNREACTDFDIGRLFNYQQAKFAIDQQQITLAMMKDWGLPANVIDAVFQAQQCPLTQEMASDDIAVLAKNLRLATMIANQQGLDIEENQLANLGKEFNIAETQLHALLQQIFTDWDTWKEILSIDKIHAEIQTSNKSLLSIPIDNTQHKGIRILLVEDDRIQLHLLSNYLNQQGHSVTNASSGEEALELILLNTPEVIIADYRMQPMDGLELCKLLRKNKEYRCVYFILITADKDTATLANAFQLGVNDFITKPITQAELNARLLGAQRTIEMFNLRSLEQEQIRNYAFELATTARKLEILTLTDQLTGLQNRRYAVSRLEQEWASYSRCNCPFGILSLDLDNFKQVNDNHGHDVGDQVLVHFAKILQKTIRTNDIACRMGGEEFIVIAPHAKPANITVLGERIREVVENFQPDQVSLAKLITVSIGAAISDIGLDENGWRDTLKRSDQALFEAKAAGRNCFKMLNQKHNRRYERFYHQALLKVKWLSPGIDGEFDVELVNLSQTGLLIKSTKIQHANVGDLIEIKTMEIENAQWQKAKIIRLIKNGFAVEFLLFQGKLTP